VARVALVTYRELPDLNADDRLAADALMQLGLRTDAVCWDDPAVDWLEYRAVVLRSTWDYHRRIRTSVPRRRQFSIVERLSICACCSKCVGGRKRS